MCLHYRGSRAVTILDIFAYRLKRWLPETCEILVLGIMPATQNPDPTEI